MSVRVGVGVAGLGRSVCVRARTWTSTCPVHRLPTRTISTTSSSLSSLPAPSILQVAKAATGRRRHALQPSRGGERRREIQTPSTDELAGLLPTMSELGLQEGDHVTVAMSGGVDSATTLRILSQFPIHLDVIFMRNWDPLLSESPSPSPASSPAGSSRLTYSYSYPSSSSSSSSKSKAQTPSSCQWEKDWDDVRRVATHVGIPSDKVRLVDLSKEYWTRVFEPAVSVWQGGGTPNPDVDCNREIKFGALLDLLPDVPRHFLATGHYGRIDRSANFNVVDNQAPQARLFRAADPGKDQTYYLSQMNDRQLARTILPLGGLIKPQVRKLAESWGLPVASKGESMGVCFIGERGKFGDFISQYTPPPEQGHLVLPSGERLAPHKGLWYYTIGQRAKIPDQLQAMYVARKGVGANGLDIVVVPGSDHPMLLCENIQTDHFHWIHSSPPVKLEQGEVLSIQVRHRMQPVPAVVESSSSTDGNNALSITPLDPLSAVSPGQIIAIWKDGWCLGSGVISRTKCL